MAKLIYGDRVGRLGKFMVGTAAVIFDSDQRILLTRRTDNGRWCLPGGRLEPGENVTEACAREVLEETGLHIAIGRLVGVYTSPDLLVEYADGNRWQLISFIFEAEVQSGTLGVSDETTDCGYYSLEEMKRIDVMEHHQERIADALAKQTTPFVR